MSNVLIYAYSVPPGRYTASPLQPTASRTVADYTVKVGVDCNDLAGIPYQVIPLAFIGKGQQYYYFNAKTSPPVVAAASGPVVDFEECLGVLQFHFVDGNGNPVSVTNGTIAASHVADSATKATLYSIAGGSTQQRFYVEAGKAHWIDLRLFRGTDPRVDRQSHYVRTNLTVGCDQIANVNIVIPSVESLGQIAGTVDVLREFEWSVPNETLVYPEFTTVVAQSGPFENSRWDTLPGDNIALPSSGGFHLLNIVPSTMDPASPGYTVSAQMMFRTNRTAQYLRTPGLGAGSNAPVVVTAGASVNLSNIFVINPGYMRGRVLLQGPPEIPGHPSLFRGIDHAGDNDENMDGIPDGAIYGPYASTIGYEGVNRRAAGARYTASFGYGFGDFDGSFDAGSNVYHGRYELALGGLQGEASIWRPYFLNLQLTSGVVTNDDEYFSNLYSIYERRTVEIEVPPNQPVTNDIGFCFSEVRIFFTSPNATFYSPQVTWFNGAFAGTDFLGKPANYFMDNGVAYGTPGFQYQATNRGQLTLYLPQGTYTLLPSVIPGDSSGGITGLEPIQITVGCGERRQLEPCLQMNLAIPPCYRSNQLSLAGSVLTRCSNEVVHIAYELNHGPSVTICTECGLNPDFDFTVTLATGDNTLRVTAYDNQGGVTFVEGVLRPDSLPPVIQCPGDITTDCNTNGAVVNFTATATDNCDNNVRVVCTPPSGWAFPAGETTVTCTATDAAGNSNQCSFKVTVNASRLSIERAVIVRWSCDGTLQHADDPSGPWTDIPGAPNPYCVPTSQAHRYYRTRQ